MWLKAFNLWYSMNTEKKQLVAFEKPKPVGVCHFLLKTTAINFG